MREALSCRALFVFPATPLSTNLFEAFIAIEKLMERLVDYLPQPCEKKDIRKTRDLKRGWTVANLRIADRSLPRGKAP